MIIIIRHELWWLDVFGHVDGCGQASHEQTPEPQELLLRQEAFRDQVVRDTPGIKSGLNLWAVVVAQLVEWSLPTPEIRGSNPSIGKCPIVDLKRKDKN